MKRYLSI